MSLYRKRLIVKMLITTILFVCTIFAVNSIVTNIEPKILFYTDHNERVLNSSETFKNMVKIKIGFDSYEKQYYALKKELEQLPYFVAMGELPYSQPISDI